MAQDDDSGFLGTTYISHGDDHTPHTGGAETDVDDDSQHNRAEDTKPVAGNHPDIEELLRHIEALENQLQAYEEDTEEHLTRLDRLTGHTITPEERTYRIQEDS